MPLHAITLPPTRSPAKGLLVLLHGWGANSQDLQGLATLMDLSDYYLVFPDAPFVHPFNAVGKMWYDFPDDWGLMGVPEFRDRPDLVSSRQQLIELLQSLPEKTGIPAAQTILGGFSQGGAMTLDVGLDFPFAGLMVLSGYLHAPVQSLTTQFPPVLMVHGSQDQIVPLQSAHRSRDALRSFGVQVQYHEFNMGHEIQPAVLRQIQNFVKDVPFNREN